MLRVSLIRIIMRWEVNVFVVRQVLLEIAVCLTSYATGISFAFPTILNQELLGPDATIKTTLDQASWIVTCLGLGGLLGFTFMPVVFDFFGRKMSNIVTNLFLLIGSLILYVATDIYSLVFARLTQGLSIGGVYVSTIGLCECISPKRRGYFMVLNKIAVAFGSLTCHGLVFYLNWRQIALLGALGSFISMIIFAFSAESPSFLAIKGKLDKSAASFKWYRGESLSAKKELTEFILAQTENLRMKERKKNINVINRTKAILMTKEFQKSFCIVTLATLCIDCSGRYFVLAYITQILIEITKSTTIAMYMSIAIDFIIIFAFVISTVLIKHYNRRTLLFSLGFCSVSLMFLTSFSIILRSKFNLLEDLNWLTPAILMLHTLITNIGLVPISHALTGEIYSIDHRALGSLLSGILFLIFLNIILKVTPLMMHKTGVEGTYLIYGSILFVLLLLLRIVLPETKDKTLQEIEDEMKGTVRKNSNVDLIKLVKVTS